VFRPGTDLDPPAAIIRPDQNSGEAVSSGEFRAIFEGRDKWDLTPRDALLFSYRLDRGSWSSPASNTVASFHGLPEGGHIFEVIARDRQGNVSVNPASLEFSVDAPWYLMPAFLTSGSGGIKHDHLSSWPCGLPVPQTEEEHSDRTPPYQHTRTGQLIRATRTCH